MKKQTSMTYALNVLQKHKAMLEANLNYTPGIIVNINMLPVYKKQLSEIKRAIECLESEEIKRERKENIYSMSL